MFFLLKMSGVNLFGEALSSNENIRVQRGHPGIGFINKNYFDKRYGFLHKIYDRFQITFNNYSTKLD